MPPTAGREIKALASEGSSSAASLGQTSVWGADGGGPVVKAGDVIEVSTRKVGESAQRGTVLEVRGELLSVRWESGRESVFIPAAGAFAVVGESTPPRSTGSAAARSTTTAAKHGAHARPVKKAPAKSSAKKATAKKATARR